MREEISDRMLLLYVMHITQNEYFRYGKFREENITYYLHFDGRDKNVIVLKHREWRKSN